MEHVLISKVIMGGNIMKTIFWIMLVAFVFVLGAITGFMIYEQYNDTYKTLTLETCDYANALTEIINVQSGAMENCMNLSENSLKRLSPLNCSLVDK